MKIPSSALRIQICKCIVDFYHAEPLKKHIPAKFSLIFCLWETHKQKKVTSSHISLNFQQMGSWIQYLKRTNVHSFDLISKNCVSFLFLLVWKFISNFILKVNIYGPVDKGISSLV